MKKLLILRAVCLAFASCLQEKDYDCVCTYVARSNGSSAGQPNKVETVTVKGRTIEQAYVECSFESKYWGQDFDGECNVQ